MCSINRLVPAVLSAAVLTMLSGCDQSGGSASDQTPTVTTIAPAAPAAAPDTPEAVTTAPGQDASATAAEPERLASAATEKVAETAADRTNRVRRLDPRLSNVKTSPNAPTSLAQPGPKPDEADKKPDVNAPPTVVLDPERLDLGEIPTNDAKAGTVRLVNTGDTPRKILDCKTSCGCTTANCQKGKMLEPGESMEVEIKLSGGARATKLSKTVTFLVSEQAPLRLPVTGEAVSFVTATPDRLDPEQHPDGRIVLTALDGQPFTIRSMYPPVIDEFATEPNAEQVVFLPWDKLRESGHRSTKLLFTLDHPKCARVNATLSANAIPRPERPDRAANQPLKAARRDLDRMLKEGETEAILTMLNEGEIEIDTVDNSGQTPLIKACRWGNEAVILALLDASADISRGDRIGRTPLMYACQSKNIEAVRVLLDAGADINQRDQIGNTPLCWAAGFGDAATVRELLSAGSELEVSGPLMGFTPLIWASLSGESGSIRALVDAGANVEAADVLQGATPVMHAVRTGGTENVKVLLDAGANLEARDNEGKTAILVAASNAGADAALVQFLLDAGADPTARTASGKSALELAEKRTDLRAADVAALLQSVLGGNVREEGADGQ